MAKQIGAEQRLELQRIWNALLRHALSKGVSFQDAEDIVSNTLRSALEHHDSTRGELLPFCRTILNNAIKNFWRDRKVDLPFNDEQWSQPDDGPDLVLEEKERMESMKRTVEKLSKLLSEEELAFMRMLGQVVDELGDRAVSETARRLGLKPTKGWDLFRRIQRKAESLEAAAPLIMTARIGSRVGAGRKTRTPMPPAAQAPVCKESMPPESDATAAFGSVLAQMRPMEELPELFGLAGAMARGEAFERFVGSL